MNLLTRLKTGLAKTSGKLADGIGGIFARGRLDDAAIEELVALLISADVGAKAAVDLVGALAKQRFNKDVTADEVKEFLAREIAHILSPYAVPLVPDITKKPCVVMMVGVNGNGKTTTLGKLSHQFRGQGMKVMLAAADTFRAAAVEQLVEWGARAAVPVITGEAAADPASVAYKAYGAARAQFMDVLLVDTAGRLQNKANLMDELQKISKVFKKIEPMAPHHTLLVLDATTGQNALSQVQAFKEMVHVTGLIVTKLDGTAKGGIVVALAKQFGLPIHAVGAGEGIDDLGPFQADDFARNLLDI